MAFRTPDDHMTKKHEPDRAERHRVEIPTSEILTVNAHSETSATVCYVDPSTKALIDKHKDDGNIVSQPSRIAFAMTHDSRVAMRMFPDLPNVLSA